MPRHCALDRRSADFGLQQLDDVSSHPSTDRPFARQAEYGSRVRRIEVAYFVVPWMYLCSVDAALTFLLFNSLRHLAPVRRNAQSVVEANVPLPAAQAMAQVPIFHRSQEHTNGASPHCTEEADGDGGRSSSDSESSEEEVQTPTSDDVVICSEPSAKV